MTDEEILERVVRRCEEYRQCEEYVDGVYESRAPLVYEDCAKPPQGRSNHVKLGSGGVVPEGTSPGLWTTSRSHAADAFMDAFDGFFQSVSRRSPRYLMYLTWRNYPRFRTKVVWDADLAMLSASAGRMGSMPQSTLYTVTARLSLTDWKPLAKRKDGDPTPPADGSNFIPSKECPEGGRGRWVNSRGEEVGNPVNGPYTWRRDDDGNVIWDVPIKSEGVEIRREWIEECKDKEQAFEDGRVRWLGSRSVWDDGFEPADCKPFDAQEEIRRLSDRVDELVRDYGDARHRDGHLHAAITANCEALDVVTDQMIDNALRKRCRTGFNRTERVRDSILIARQELAK